MPFQKGAKNFDFNDNRYAMSLSAIAKDLDIAENEVICIIYGALNKLRRDRYKHLEEYQYDSPDEQRISAIGDIEPSTLRNTEYDFSERSTGISPPVN